jgi:hypothetical protein
MKLEAAAWKAVLSERSAWIWSDLASIGSPMIGVHFEELAAAALWVD